MAEWLGYWICNPMFPGQTRHSATHWVSSHCLKFNSGLSSCQLGFETLFFLFIMFSF